MAKAAHPDSNIIFGAVIDDSLGDEVRITVIAAGFDRSRGRSARRAASPHSASTTTTSATASTSDRRATTATATTSSTCPSSSGEEPRRRGGSALIEFVSPGVRIVFTDRRGGGSAYSYDSLNLADHVGDDPDAVSANRARAAERLADGGQPGGL